MIFVSAYNSQSLDENSSLRYQEGAIVHITITHDDKDVSGSFNKHVHTGLGKNVYPSWDKLALCLRTDWKRLKYWSLEEGAILKKPLQEAFRKSFDKPEICRSVSALLE